MRLARCLGSLLLIVLSALQGGCAHAPASLVAPGIYRSGQPTRAELAHYRADIKLNTAIEGADPAPPGVTIYREGWLPAGPVSHEAIAAALWDLEHAARPVLIHCTHGQDRTSMLVGLWRIEHDGWTPQRAWAEMLAYGFHPSLVGLKRSFEEWTGWRP